MSSIRKQILDAMKATLEGAGKPAGVQVFLNRDTKFEQTELPAVNVIWVDEKPDRNPKSNPLTNRRLSVKIESNANDEDTLDSVLVWAIASLLADEQLGGLSSEILEQSTERNATPSDYNYIAATVDLLVSYRTLAGDLTKKG